MNQRLLKAVSLVSAAALMGGIILSGCSGSGNGSNSGGAASTPSGGSSNGAEKTEIVVGRVAGGVWQEAARALRDGGLRVRHHQGL